MSLEGVLISIPLSMVGFLAGGQVFSFIEATTIRYFIEENPDHLHYGLSVVS